MSRKGGFTLLELTVAAGIMGLLFLSGLQLLGIFFTAQSAGATRAGQKPADAMLRIQAVLRRKLNGATRLEIGDDGKQVRFDGASQLDFIYHAGCHAWQLESSTQSEPPHVLFQWSKTDAGQHFAFARQADNPQLLDIYLGQSDPALTLWLRNSS